MSPGAAQHVFIVMAGLVPAIHVFGAAGKDVDARDKPGHDEEGAPGAGKAGAGATPSSPPYLA